MVLLKPTTFIQVRLDIDNQLSTRSGQPVLTLTMLRLQFWVLKTPSPPALMWNWMGWWESLIKLTTIDRCLVTRAQREQLTLDFSGGRNSRRYLVNLSYCQKVGIVC